MWVTGYNTDTHVRNIIMSDSGGLPPASFQWMLNAFFGLILAVGTKYISSTASRMTKMEDTLHATAKEHRDIEREDGHRFQQDLMALRAEMKDDRERTTAAHAAISANMITRSEFSARMDDLKSLLSARK